MMPVVRVLLAALLVVSGSEFGAAQTTDALGARAAEAAAAMNAGRFEDAPALYGELAAARPGEAGLLMNLGDGALPGGTSG